MYLEVTIQALKVQNFHQCFYSSSDEFLSPQSQFVMELQIHEKLKNTYKTFLLSNLFSLFYLFYTNTNRSNMFVDLEGMWTTLSHPIVFQSEKSPST